jgi:hypothetical protein
MKIKPEHYAVMLDAMRTAQAKVPHMTRQWYVDKGIGQDPAMQHRWDLFHSGESSTLLLDALYTYADDTHIDTALRKIVAQLEAESVQQTV